MGASIVNIDGSLAYAALPAVTAVPEPATLGLYLMGFALLGRLVIGRRRSDRR